MLEYINARKILRRTHINCNVAKNRKLQMNIEKLRAAVKFIAQEPRRLNMSSYTERVSFKEEFKNPSCGTTFCLAGVGIMLEAIKRKVDYIEIIQEGKNEDKIAGNIFDIQKDMRIRLFHLRYWPEVYRKQYIKFRDDMLFCHNPHVYNYITKKLVGILDERVEFFIKTKGTDDPNIYI